MQPGLFDLGSVVNVASVEHRSPFRYPGGKTWLVPHIRHWLALRSAGEFCEPFAGGAIVGLSALFDGLCERLTIVELDASVGAVWRAIALGKGKELAQRIQDFTVSEASVRRILDGRPRSLLDRAFATIIRNRMQRGGIMAPGASLMKSGENGKGLLSRWYPQTLARRILAIHEIRQRILVVEGDGIAYMRANADQDITWFIDPPYTVAGRRLYAHSELDHAELFQVASTLKGDFLMTYDDANPVRKLASQQEFVVKRVAMKNTHHSVMNELLIGRCLDWVGT